MTDVINLSEARAQKECNAELWTVLDALKACIRDIESGELNPDMVFVALREENPDHSGQLRYPYFCAGAGTMEFHGLLAIHLKKL